MANSLAESDEPPRRSAGALRTRRSQQNWPAERDFRILAIDGGGIRGIFPASFLAGLEQRYLAGGSVAGYFDLIAGTSTGGILAVGLGSGLTARELRDLYVQRGGEIFPQFADTCVGRARGRLSKAFQYFRYRYDREALHRIMRGTLGDRLFGSAITRLCIPSFDGRYGEVYIFKTPHHPDFRRDATESMVKVACATAAAPTFFQPLRDQGYTFVDGGVWANNPVMIALVDALSCFDVPPRRIHILSVGCGDDPYVVDSRKVAFGGIWHWRDIIFAAMHLQSLNALGQAGLLIGADQLIRIDAPTTERKIAMDDWRRASNELPLKAAQAVVEFGDGVAARFFAERAATYTPLPI